MTEPQLERYRHIIWDWNGTLLDDAWLCVDILNTLLEKYGKDSVTLEAYMNEFDFPVQKYYESLGFDFTKESFAQVAADYISIYDKRRFECELTRGAVEALNHFSKKNVTQSILSAYQQSMLEEIVGHFGLTPFFAHLAGLNDYYAAGKINSGKLLIEKLDFPQGDILLIGDTLHDYEVAAELGIDCVLIEGHNCCEKLKKANVPVYKSLMEIKK